MFSKLTDWLNSTAFDAQLFLGMQIACDVTAQMNEQVHVGAGFAFISTGRVLWMAMFSAIPPGSLLFQRHIGESWSWLEKWGVLMWQLALEMVCCPQQLARSDCLEA